MRFRRRAQAEPSACRSTAEVFQDHLELSAQNRFEEDIARNSHPAIVVLTGFGLFEGHDAVHQLASQLRRELPDATFDYTTRVVRGEVAFLEWTADARGARVRDGADTFVIRDGLIVIQTIHYTVELTRREPRS